MWQKNRRKNFYFQKTTSFIVIISFHCKIFILALTKQFESCIGTTWAYVIIVKHAECSKQVYGPKCTHAHSTIWKQPLAFPLSLAHSHKLSLSLSCSPKYLKPFIVIYKHVSICSCNNIFWKKKQKISASAMLTTKICYISTFGTIIFTFSFADIHNFINDFFLFDFSQWFFFSSPFCYMFWKKRKRISWELFSHMET